MRLHLTLPVQDAQSAYPVVVSSSSVQQPPSVDGFHSAENAHRGPSVQATFLGCLKAVAGIGTGAPEQLQIQSRHRLSWYLGK